MKITSLTAVDERGVTHVFEGIEGWIRVRTVSKKGEPYVQAADAHIVLPEIPLKAGS